MQLEFDQAYSGTGSHFSFLLTSVVLVAHAFLSLLPCTVPLSVSKAHARFSMVGVILLAKHMAGNLGICVDDLNT